jgi:aryl-alcohol dehydrogenase-like predicted oxidoreductase
MKLNEFGRTGMRVSEIGFGGSRIGGFFAGRDSSREARSVLLKALDSGVNFYDTADMYAQGESEALIGAAFRDRRSGVIIATKAGYCLPARRSLLRRVKPLLRPLVHALGLKRARLPSGFSGALSQDFSPAYLARALEASLKRLKTDYVDLYQLHSPGPAFMQGDAFGEALDALATFQRQGKVRHFGVATEIPEDARFCLDAPGIASIQLGFGLLDREALEQGTLAAAHARGLGIIARGCLAGGLLKEGLDASQLEAATPKWPRIMALRTIAGDAGRSPIDLALQYCRGTPEISVTLLGMRTEEHLRGNLAHLARPALDARQYAALAAV